MSIGSFLRRAVPTAIGYATGGPVGAVQAFAGADAAADERKQIRFANRVAQEREQSSMEMMSNQSPNIGAVQVPPFRPTTQQAGNTGFFSGVGDFFRGAGEVVRSAFDSGIPQLFGAGRPRNVSQQPAITSVTNMGAQESQGSGSIQAGFGTALAPLVGAARQFIKSPGALTGLGTGAGIGIGMLGSGGSGMRMTRKMKSQARSLLNMTGGNLSLTADFLGMSEEMLVALLLKRFRNDGPVVTKAALRKTKSTIRKLKNMCDMYDDLRPAARRRSPMRRAKSSTTLIKN
tara:strand:- start:91 stop:957 length:867 start_codon:yes stop_codon:yes gene_type:complete